jgi:peptidoglycan/LPS O-acetylase OafA/YrhL
MSTEQTRAVSTGKYRPEIDGLRAFAVIAVIINHFNKDILPGGYLGVDIFFVISGYVITSSLYGRPSKDFKDFISGFYERRIKRLVPALSVFVLITSITICLFNPNPHLPLRTGLTSLFGLSNIYLLKQSTDYFAQSTEFNTFTHTWSLGVEEQFYILFPFLIWFSGFGHQTKNGARNLFLTVGALTIASLIGFVYLYATNQPAAYFLMPSRFWEMASGCLIFIGLKRRASIERFLEKIPPLLMVSMIVTVMFLPISMACASTIAVVVFSSILIVCLKKQTAAFKVFTNPKIIYIGLISYSLYLWHWGVLSISRWTIGVHWWSVPFQVALMLSLAIASYLWIETPLRKGNWFGKRWKTLVVGGAVLVTTSGGLVILKKPMDGQLFLGEKLSKPQTNIEQKCREAITGKTDCGYLDTDSDKTLWVIGDSHAGVLYRTSENVAKSKKMNLRFYTAGGTPFPPVGHYRKAHKKDDLQKLEDFRVIEKTLHKQLSTGDVVLISMRLPYHFGGTYYEYPSSDFAFPRIDGTFSSQQEYFENWINSVKNLASIAKNRNATIIIQTPTPEWEKEITKQCATANRQWFNSLSREDCKIHSSFFTDNTTGKYIHLFKNLKNLAVSTESIRLLDTYSIVCPEKICKFHDGMSDIYMDDDHIDPRWASDFISPKIQKLIE